MPQLGILRTSFFFGLLNAVVALVLCFYFNQDLRWPAYMKLTCLGVITVLTLGFVASERILAFTESMTYPDKIVYATSSP